MPYSIRVALPGYDATADTNIDHYALYADQDYVLIKEQSRGRTTLQAGETATITHNLGYIPLCLVYGEIAAGVWSQIVGDSSAISAWIELTTTQLLIHNSYAAQKIFTYLLFFDRQV